MISFLKKTWASFLAGFREGISAKPSFLAMYLIIGLGVLGFSVAHDDKIAARVRHDGAFGVWIVVLWPMFAGAMISGAE